MPVVVHMYGGNAFVVHSGMLPPLPGVAWKH